MTRLLPAMLYAASLCFAVFCGEPAAAQGAAVSRIAFGSCADQDEPQPIWDAILEAQPDLWIWAGDNIYGDTEDMQALAADWQTQLEQPGYSALRARGIPILGTWDDHDYGANDAGADYSQREASQQLFLDFLGVPKNTARRDRAGVYHAEIFGSPGRRVQVILLDTRYHRSELQAYRPETTDGRRVYRPVRDKDATILGEAQWQWLETQLQQPAELRLIVSSIQVLSAEHVYEKWSNFPEERRRLLKLINSIGAGGVLLLSGDRHHAELSRLDDSGAYPLYDLTASGLNKSQPLPAGAKRPPEPNRLRQAGPYRGHHYGWIEIDWEQPDPLIRLAIRDVENRTPIRVALKLSEIHPTLAAQQMARDFSAKTGAPEANPAMRVIDGAFEDWAGPDLIASDAQHVYLRLPLPTPRSLHRGDNSLRLQLSSRLPDAQSPIARDRSSALDIIFNPVRAPDDRRWGPRVVASGSSTGVEVLYAAGIDLQVAPTHAARWFEVRLDRKALLSLVPIGSDELLELQLFEEGPGSDTSRLLAREAVPLSASISDAVDTEHNTLPGKPAGALRVMSYNLLWGSHLADPEPFARMFRALDADVILLQEWSRERITEGEVVQWFKTHVDSAADWHAAVAGDAGTWHGTLVVAPYLIKGRLPRYTPMDAGGWSFPLRVAGGLVETPLGTLLAASVHLKASGYLGSAEDQRRLAEAKAVNRLLVGMHAAAEPDFVVLGGDFNLNGTPRVIDHAVRMLDADGSALSLAQPTVTGDAGLLTTFGRRSPQSRLDYVGYSDYSLMAAQAFVLDSRELSKQALRRYGLQTDDSESSDHRPVVVDFLLRWR